MSPQDANACHWGSRRVYIMVLLCQIIGTNTFITLPNIAVTHGTTGYILSYVLTYIVLGIPLLYMEFTISQFTTRDCLEVWRAREFLSHIGYIHIFYQTVMIIYNHMVSSFVLHYFLISFENPIPYYICGRWATKDCGILATNYTVNQDCIKEKEPTSYCEYIFITFPEYQYWRYYILGSDADYFHIAWRVCLASGLCCVFLFLCCFKTTDSMKWFMAVFTLYPLLGYVLLIIGSMMQKGLVVMYEEALDSDFSVFMTRVRASNIILIVMYTLNIGTGISFNLASGTSFRTPCYSNTVITVAVCTVFTVLTVCTAAMMSCPYAYEHDIPPYSTLKFPIALVFGKTPRFLYEYSHKSFWLILIYSCNALVGLSTNVVLIISLLKLLIKRNRKFSKYTSVICFVIVVVLFFGTIPLLGARGINFFVDFKKYINFIPLFCSILECVVFVLWYGLDKFSEDLHFMQGIQPKAYMKASWVLSCAVLSYVFCYELYYQKNKAQSVMGETLGWWTLVSVLGGSILLMIIKLSIAAIKKRFRNAICLDPTWGPRSELLLRSRAMFTAQAMTKEYLYRQYHLQAGIIARQRRSNIRTQ
ncbi:sodium-dependent proline transporter-like [Manduca sexta]|uniref:sodium-dependent proline transporter-like n=1 Tax=Manduca sexta TaxID=7130 RepID=UPI00188F14B2|nr:sodium-dependent proline transporter-like [Manduca sexta]